MDLVPSAPLGKPSLRMYETDHITELLAALAPLDAVAGVAVPKRRMAGGIAGIEVPAAKLLEVARTLRDVVGYDVLSTNSGVDMVDHFESIYHFRSLAKNWLLQVRVKLPVENPAVDSLVSLYPAANWMERETYDMYGIVFNGHPDLRRILTDDEFNGYPLRKSFRPTPITMHDRATTQTSGEQAISGEQQRGIERMAPKHLGQGDEERTHPGKLTFGSAAVYLTTGQGVESPGLPNEPVVGEHGYVADPDTKAGPTSPQRG
ncbi:MAG: NADH-quinone oxidoreductase subunit C [Ktedonobacterales bacterium]